MSADQRQPVQEQETASCHPCYVITELSQIWSTLHGMVLVMGGLIQVYFCNVPVYGMDNKEFVKSEVTESKTSNDIKSSNCPLVGPQHLFQFPISKSW